LVIIFVPLNIFYLPTRKYFFYGIGRIISAPFYTVSFSDNFLGDHLCSLVQVLLDVTYMGCYYASSAFLSTTENHLCDSTVSISPWIVTFLPYYWRLMQCLRRYYDDRSNKLQLVNAGKYFTAMMVTLCNLLYSKLHTKGLFGVWIFVAILSSLYAFLWDIKMDWGLLEGKLLQDKLQNKFLRKTTVLKNKGIYYFVTLMDFGLRVTWISTVSPGNFGLSHVQHVFVVTILSSLEIIRRITWSFFRLENEHMNNCEKYRVTRLIPTM